MSCYSASIHLWMNEMLTVGLQPFKLWMNCFSGMVGFFRSLLRRAIMMVECEAGSSSGTHSHIHVICRYETDFRIFRERFCLHTDFFFFFLLLLLLLLHELSFWVIVTIHSIWFIYFRDTRSLSLPKSLRQHHPHHRQVAVISPSLSLCCCKSSIFYRGKMMLLSVIVLPGNVHHVGVGCGPATHYHFCNSTGMSDDDWVENCIYHQIQRWYGSIVLGIIIRFGKIFLTQFLFLLVHFFVVIPSVFPSVCRYVRPSICPIVIYTHILKCWFNFSKRIMMVLFYLFIHIACEIFV